MIVIDASAMLEVLLMTPRGGSLIDRLFSDRQTLHAPHLLDLEIAQVLRRYCQRGAIQPRRATQALTDLSTLGLTRYPHETLLSRIWELRHNISAYDASYVALAEALSAPLITSDRRLANSPGHLATIELL